MSTGSGDQRRSDEKRRREAAFWFARMRGPMAEAHRARFDRWRAGRPDRQAVYDRLLRRWDDAAVLAGSSPDLASPADRSRIGGAGRPAARWLLAPLLAAAAAGVALILSPSRPAWIDTWPVPSVWSQRAATEVGQIRSVRLADGSSVTLDTDSIVISRISRTARRLTLLRGRARFDVAHDPARPFVVSADGAQVAARGTLFDVSLGRDHRVAVTLIRGAVDVLGPVQGASIRPARARPVRLVAGQQIAFDRRSPSVAARPAAAAASPWPDGLLTFEATPLSDALAQANRYAHSPLRLASPDLGDLRVSGVFRATEPRAFAESLAATFDLRLTVDPKGELVLDRPAPASAGPAA